MPIGLNVHGTAVTFTLRKMCANGIQCDGKQISSVECIGEK